MSYYDDAKKENDLYLQELKIRSDKRDVVLWYIKTALTIAEILFYCTLSVYLLNFIYD